MIEWLHPGKASVLVGGGFGSEAKGSISAYLASNSTNIPLTVAVSNAGAQAGHTTKRRDGGFYICFHLPTHGVERPEAIIYLSPGSIIDPASFEKELFACKVDRTRVQIHPRAAVITAEHQEAERAPSSAATRLGSTQKGVGAALAAKIARSAALAGEQALLADIIGKVNLNAVLMARGTVALEVPQGMGLSINHGLSYPHCTSRDCYVTSGMSDAGIHPEFLGEVCMVIRTKPIRVGNIVDQDSGKEVGNSGPFYRDSVELTWERDLPGVVPERTTVTKRVRRIASWSDTQYRDALLFNRPSIVALTFCDYMSGVEEFSSQLVRMRDIEQSLALVPEKIFSVGPNVEDVTDSADKVVAWLEANK